MVSQVIGNPNHLLLGICTTDVMNVKIKMQGLFEIQWQFKYCRRENVGSCLKQQSVFYKSFCSVKHSTPYH